MHILAAVIQMISRKQATLKSTGVTLGYYREECGGNIFSHQVELLFSLGGGLV